MNKYLIIEPEGYCGMGGYIWQTIRAMYHNPNKLYYIDFATSIYKGLKNKDDNVWDYFFEQPHIKTKPTPEQTEGKVGIIFDPASEFLWKEIKPNTPQEIQRRRNIFSDIIKNNIVLKPHVQKKIYDYVEKNFKNKKILGVHFRGTDHPLRKPMDLYLQQIKHHLVNFDHIFICSDEHDRFRLAEIVFRKKAISYDSIRSINANPLHSPFYEKRFPRNWSEEYQYKIAEDVIIEAYLMSKVDLLMCCEGSNVNHLSRTINPNLPTIDVEPRNPGY
jgi:hypothetical protein